jgi:amidase
VLPSTLGYQRSTWAGNPANPYDTTRAASLGSSSGSGVSVSATLVMASLGEETRASCRGPANHTAVALILPHQSLLGFTGGAIGADIYCDRSGILCRTIADCAKVLDALKDRVEGYYDPRDPFTTVPRASVLNTPYASHAQMPGAPGTLVGVRLGIIRESMVYAPGSQAEGPIVTAAAQEIKTILGDRLGATLVESSDPLWRKDPEIETMQTDFRRARARLVPVFMPELLFRLGLGGQPLFQEFAAAIVPTEFMPGQFFGTGTMQPIDYGVELAEARIAPPANLDIATIQEQALAMGFRFHIPQYLTRRATDWKARGFTEILVDFPTLNTRSKCWGDDQRAAFKNWEQVTDMRNPHGQRQGVNERIMLRELLRRVDMMVLLENRLEALVRLHTPFPPGKIGGARQPGIQQNLRLESFNGPNAGLTEVLIPAGYVTTVYDPLFALSPDGTRYVSGASDTPTTMPAPGLPFSRVFRAEPGKEDMLLTIASAYEAASKRRVPPPAFGRLPAKSRGAAP